MKNYIKGAPYGVYYWRIKGADGKNLELK